jgi:hypothetical protein
VTKTQITLGKESISLPGARAEVTAERSGAFKRTVTTTLLVTAENGRAITYSYGGTFGTKGAASRGAEGLLSRLAVRINSAAIEAAEKIAQLEGKES